MSILEDVRLSEEPGSTIHDAGPEGDLRESIGDRISDQWPRDYALDRDNARYEPAATVADRAAGREMNSVLAQSVLRRRAFNVMLIIIGLALAAAIAFTVWR